MKFSEIHKLLQDDLGIDHLADIAREFNVSPQAVSNWKSRDKVPYKYVKMIRNKLELAGNYQVQKNKNDYIDDNKVLTEYDNDQHFIEETISFTDILLIIARELKVVLLIPSIFCIFTIIYSLFFVSPIFESTAKILSSRSGSQSQTAGLAAQFGISLPPMGQSRPEWSYPELVKSRTIAREMIKRKFDTEKYGLQKPLLQILIGGNNNQKMSEDMLITHGVNSFINMVDIYRRGSYYDLTISAFEPILARDIIISLLEVIDSHQREYNKAKTSATRQFIDERIVSTKNELQIAEEALKNFRDSNRLINNSPALLLEQARLLREVTVLTSVYKTLKQQLETAKIEEVKDSDYVIVLDPPVAPIYRSKPKRKQMVVFAGIMGLIMGLFLALIKNYMRNIKLGTNKKISEIRNLFMDSVYSIFPFKRNR